jgi:hypothetical protein
MNWRDVVKGVAPALGAALFGQQAGAAISVLSQKLLGKSTGTEEEVEAAVLALKPEDQLKLLEAEHAFTLQLLDKVAASEQIDAADRASARAREIAVKDWIPAALAIATMLAFFTLLYLLVAHAIPEPNKTAFDILLGVLAGAVAQILNYYFGSSSGSAAARSVIGRIAEGKK